MSTHLAGDPAFLRDFPNHTFPSRLQSAIGRSQQSQEDAQGLLLRLHAPWIGAVVARFAGRGYELHGPDIEQDAKLKFLEVAHELATQAGQGADLPDNVEAFLRAAVLNLLRNKLVRAGRERRYVPQSIEAFDEALNALYAAEEERLSGLDVLVMGHTDLNPDSYVDPAEAVQTRQFWAEVDQIVGKERRVLLVEAHVPGHQRTQSQRALAERMGRGYKSLRDQLDDLRARLRRNERFRTLYGHEGRRSRAVRRRRI